MAKKIHYPVEYHPEFLFFNTFVRDHHCDPKHDSWVWEPQSQDRLSPYRVCNFMLFDVIKTKQTKFSRLQLAEKMLSELNAFPGALPSVDGQAWINYARSLGIENMLERYLPRIFRHFKEPFSVPTIKLSPVRLTPCARNHFRSILSGQYDPHHVTSGDPAFYDCCHHCIYFPLPERETRLPHAFIDWVLLHELLHSAVRPFLLPFVEVGPFIAELPSNRSRLNRAFAEMFSEVGAFSVLRETGVAPKRTWSTLLDRRVRSDAVYQSSFVAMTQLGVSELAALLQPVFQIARDLSFLDREFKKTTELTAKQLGGILTKKYRYKKRVKGMDEKSLRTELTKRGKTRLQAVLNQINDLDIFRLLKGASVRARNPARKRKLEELTACFHPDREAEWIATNVFRL